MANKEKEMMSCKAAKMPKGMKVDHKEIKKDHKDMKKDMKKKK